MFLSCKIRNCGSTSSKPCKTKLHNYCAAPRLRSSWIEQSLARCYKLSTHNGRMLYRGFPSKLHHDVPPWIETGAFFHIRIAIEREKKQSPLTAVPLAQTLLDSARFYEIKQRWHITLFLLMPDHLHALLSFASDESMSNVIGDWKHFQTRKHGIIWQEGYFDHRLRDD